METKLPPTAKLIRCGEFLVFLWGMETKRAIHPESTKKYVFSLPMRDGNYHNVYNNYKSFSVFSLPMRDGNEARPMWSASNIYRF